MQELKQVKNYKIVQLDKELATKYIDRLVELDNLVPKVKGDPEEILAENKGERIMYGKWEYSLAIMEGDTIIAFIIAYERKSESNDQYPENTMYINTIVVDSNYQGQGLGKELINFLIERTKSTGFKYLDGDVNFSVQTNSAEFNTAVQKFYESFGFKKRAEKVYDNRVDNVYGLN